MVAENRARFGDEILTYVDGDVGGGSPSTLVDLTQPAETVVRKGPISF